jgi:hypothetical protein
LLYSLQEQIDLFKLKKRYSGRKKLIFLIMKAFQTNTANINDVLYCDMMLYFKEIGTMYAELRVKCIL